MKKVKVLIMSVAMLATTGAFAQKGLWFEGNINYLQNQEEIKTVPAPGTTTTVTLKDNAMSFGLGVNYSFDKHWAVGLQLGYNNHNYFQGTGVEWTDKYFWVTPQIWFSMNTPFKNLKWTPRGYFTFGTGSREYEAIAGVKPGDADLSIIRLGVDLFSFEYSLNRHVAFGFAMGLGDIYYQSQKYDKVLGVDGQEDNNTNIKFNLGKWQENAVDFRVGFHYYL